MTGEVIEKLSVLLQGKIPDKIGVEGKNGEEVKLLESIIQLITFMKEIHEFIFPLFKGELNNVPIIHRNNYLASLFKELHSRLQHLTWQAGQVAKGDYSQRVDFMGDFSEAFNCMVTSLERKEMALQQKIAELEDAAVRIKKLEGILPICANCKKIRLEGADPGKKEGWVGLQEYIEDRSEVIFTHSICPRLSLISSPLWGAKLQKWDLFLRKVPLLVFGYLNA
jgi:hypothetical protein